MDKKFRKYSIILFLFMFILNHKTTLAQETLSLNLKEAIDIAQEQNWEIRKTSSDIKIAEAVYNEFRSLFLPKIQLSESVVNTNNPLQTFGIKLMQETVTQNDFNPELLNDPGSITNFNTRLEINQPLINPEGIFYKKAGRDQLIASKLSANRTKKLVTFNIKKAYFLLKLLNRKRDVLKQALKAAKAHHEIAINNLAEGYLKNQDVLSAEIRVLEVENQLTEINVNIQTTEDQFSVLLGKEISYKFLLKDEFIESFDHNKNEESNLENREDILAFKHNIKAIENQYKAAQKKFLPNLNAFGSYEFNDSNFLGTNAKNYTVGASLNWKIFNGYKRISETQKTKAKLEKAKISFDKYVIQSNNEIQKAKRNFELSKQKINISRLSIKQAKESLRVRKNRFEEGLEKTSDLLASEVKLAEKELEYLNALYHLNVSYYLLEYLLE